MNAVEIESAISDLALEPFDAAEFPFVFLAAFGNKETALKRLRVGNNNASDVPGGVLLRSNIHIAACEPGTVGEALKSLHASPATTKSKAKFILATDGQTLEAEELVTGETITCDYQDLPNHFGFLLPLAGISTIKEIKDNPIDVRATSRMNKLYVELLNENPDWAKSERRHDMNHFMSRLVFCFFAEDTDIFNGDGLFTKTVEQYSEHDGSNTHQVLSEIFRAMNIKQTERAIVEPRLPSWANGFPYVNGGLFSGSTEVPRFTRMARTYLLHAGKLNWQKINPDIFGSMIQAVADDEERGALGMHYTSVPNILKVLNPLFLDDLRAQLEAAGDNKAKLLNLRKRMARIRVFDPACGSGNFLVIAYKQMREIEAEINRRRGEANNRSEIPLTNFRGIELRDFPAEIARLALIIAEFQCDVLYRGQQDALAEFLPLNAQNWIVCGNALRLDWLSICPPTGTGVKVLADDLFGTPLNQSEIDFENDGGETYICGNPPYLGSTWQTDEQKTDLEAIFSKYTKTWKTLDYVAGWFMKAADYGMHTNAITAFVSTNSICQGQQVSYLWPFIFNTGHEIAFAHTSFKWANLASHNAGVTVAIVGIARNAAKPRRLYSDGDEKQTVLREVDYINAYLVAGANVIVEAETNPFGVVSPMTNGNKPADGGHLILDLTEAEAVRSSDAHASQFVRPFVGSDEAINGKQRFCLWINDASVELAQSIPAISARMDDVRVMRQASTKELTRRGARTPHAFQQIRQKGDETLMVVPRVSSENRPYLPVALLSHGTIIGDRNFALYDAPLWNLAIIASRLHWVWIGTVCVRMRTDFSYSNTLGWNTFPVPRFTEQNKADLTRCAEDILLAREAHFPATIADLYDPENMPDNLRHAHERNDEVLERIYIGRRFKNDTERLEKLFDLYTKMTANTAKSSPKKTREKKA
ncbi:class I SAM-dependent DNA methyltransferase [Pseudomonas gingeri]|uniref:site-specific DNA-methyltransferase (adenine-specific) n=1 Tax=Pseudomonas gingeri TaxID=117681 RepID=A0A7Y8BPE1_9PSED|nr:DNA methyltransferase [Pseudomonas gingeri]NWB51104.1 class I SAM-dependent DNA methyltransferase [Pseudomonas gingeri]NWB97649.1 class I SAM-dependent DNA methyltransferase [Pseudomonas gingeri]